MIIFHDNLTAYFVRKYTTEKIKFQKISPGKCKSSNDERFIVYKKWVNSDKYKKILFVDTDVFFRDNPFKFMLPHNDDKLLTGQDIGTFGPNWWMRKQ